jgi:hypothetical protein
VKNEIEMASVHTVNHTMYHSVAWNEGTAPESDPEIFIMSEERYLMLSTVRGFTNLNGSTYQEHIIMTAGERIPVDLHESIRQSSTADAALKLLKDNYILYAHEDGVVKGIKN